MASLSDRAAATANEWVRRALVFIKWRLVEIAGLAVCALALAVAMALVSYSPGDPNWDSSGDGGGIENWLGLPGAYAANVALQSFGLGWFFLIIAMLGWGWRILSHRGLPRFWLRLMLVPPGIWLTSVMLAFWLPPLAGDLPLNGYGYWGGASANAIMNLLLGLPPALVLWSCRILLLAGTLALLAAASGVEAWEWRALGRGLRRGLALAFAPLRRPDAGRGDVPPATPGPRAKKKSPSRVSTPSRKTRPGRRAAAEKQPELALEPSSGFQFPPLGLLAEPDPALVPARSRPEALEQNARMLESVLEDFGIKGEIINVRPGPVVTLYELEPARGIKSSRVIGLADDIARSMSAVSARVAVVPGRNVIGIELPNQERETVLLSELLSTAKYEKSKASLPLALGKDISGAPVIVDLANMPHLLVAGTTGSGKSVAINAMILSLLYRLSPEQCRLVLIDPKMLELSVYEDIPHLLTQVVTDPKKSVVALKWAVKEMEERYRNMSKLGVRNIGAYNARVIEARKKGEVLTRRVQTGFDPESGEPVYEDQEYDLTPLPHVVIVIDEMADLMLVAGKDVEASVQRLAQMARAAGLHMIMATQRPSVDVITGTIKANFPTRISFQVTSKIDSRTILGDQGAEQLLGRGDMLYMAGGSRITRVHGAFVSDEEVENVAAHLRAQGAPEFLEDVTVEDEDFDPLTGQSSGDELYDKAVALVAREGKASTSFIQRHLQIGYNRAARIIEEMEKQGVVGPANHVGKREILIGDH